VIDYGLLMSVIVAWAASSFAWRVHPPDTFDSMVSALDVLLVPGFVGLVVGRLSTLALDDPRAIGSISDMIVIRSGVEFWPAVAAAALMVAWSARVAALAPVAMVAYGGYEAACLFRDGCYGPPTPVVLTPDGLSTPMLPVGILMGASAIAAAVLVRWLGERGWPSGAIVSVVVALIGLILSIGSIWLPKVGGGLSRQHRTSIVITIVAGLATGALLMLGARRATERATP